MRISDILSVSLIKMKVGHHYETRIKKVDRYISRIKEQKFLNEDSTEELVVLIYDVIYSLSRIDREDWKVFHTLFKEAKTAALISPADESNFYRTTALLLNNLEKYKAYIQGL